MGSKTTIAWTGRTWNPWKGCHKVSAGCKFCYMFTDQERYGQDPHTVMRTADKTFYAPLSKKWEEPGLVFTCSWSDFFIEEADQWRDEVWDIIKRTPHLVYQVLTKRPERIAEHLPADWGKGYPNVWLGVSIEDRRFVDRADILRTIPATVRFISAEPLIGPLLPDAPYCIDQEHVQWPLGDAPVFAWRPWADGYDGPGLCLEGIHWIIVGGESGATPRPMEEQWVRDLKNYCDTECWQDSEGLTEFFMKQFGTMWARQHGLKGKAENPDEFPSDLRVRRYPAGLPEEDLLQGPSIHPQLF